MTASHCISEGLNVRTVSIAEIEMLTRADFGICRHPSLKYLEGMLATYIITIDDHHEL